MNDVTASRFLTAKYNIQQFFARKIVKIVLLALILLVVVFVLWWKFRRPQRRYGKHRSGYARRGSYHGRRRR